MRHVASVTILLTVLFAVSPAGALEENGDIHRSPGTLAAEGLEKIFQALDLFIESIPRFEPPVLSEEGDIILRRKRDPQHDVDPETPMPPGRWIAI